MKTARVKYEEKADTRIILEELQEILKKERGHYKRKSFKQDLTSAKDLTTD